MKCSGLSFTIALGMAGTASAGGLLLPGAGAISTSRAGASVASVDDGESIALNPAGIAKAHGTQIQIGISAIDYFLSFRRNGDYDPIAEESVSYAGQRYPTMTNDAKPPLGIGSFQPVPVIAVVSDLGERIPGLHVAAGLYAPNAYPFRDMNTVNGVPYFVPNANGSYSFPTQGGPPPPTRYDIIHEEAAIILPSVDVSYRILPNLDVGARYSLGIANLASTVAVWGNPGNYEEYVKSDGLFTLKATDNLVQTYGLGVAYRPIPPIEIGANLTGPIDIHGKGTAYSSNGSNVTLSGQPIVVEPVADADARCAKGGTAAALKGCVDVELPLTVQVGARYKFLDAKGVEQGDVEVDLDYENWGKQCDYTKDPNCLNASDFHVTVDAQVAVASMPTNGLALQNNIVGHGLQDTYAVRVGGSYHVPVADHDLIARAGVGYDTAAALPGWERTDLDGAARTTLTAGASYKLDKVRFDLGFGVILEGTRSTTRDCNPTSAEQGCSGNGMNAPVPGWRVAGDNTPTRVGPDPISPILAPQSQLENPVNEGTFKSHYILIMLGASYWF